LQRIDQLENLVFAIPGGTTAECLDDFNEVLGNDFVVVVNMELWYRPNPFYVVRASGEHYLSLDFWLFTMPLLSFLFLCHTLGCQSSGMVAFLRAFSLDKCRFW
jgi:hypothetical protein